MIPEFDMSDDKIFDDTKVAADIRQSGLPLFIWGCALTAQVVNARLQKMGVNVNGFVTDKPELAMNGAISKETLLQNYSSYSLVRGFEDLTYKSDEEIKSLWRGCQKVYTIPNCYDDVAVEEISREFYLANKAAFDEVYDNLADELSKKSLAAYIQAKILNTQTPLLSVAVSPQYFFKPSIWKYNDSDVLLDCGAFDGDSILDFVALRGNSYDKVIGCEPDPANFTKMKDNLKTHGVKNFVALNVGLGSEKGKIKFKSNGDASSAFSDSGNLEIVIDTIDNITNNMRGWGIYH